MNSGCETQAWPVKIHLCNFAGMRADQMMIKCSHTEGRNPCFLACMEHVATMSLLLCLYFLQPEIYRLCLINVFLGWKSLAVFCGWLFTVQSMKSTGKKCINVLYLAGGNVEATGLFVLQADTPVQPVGLNTQLCCDW